MVKKIKLTNSIELLYSNIKEVIESARNTVYKTANAEMVKSYWLIGKLIIEEEQQGKERANYGEEIITQLSERLTQSIIRQRF